MMKATKKLLKRPSPKGILKLLSKYKVLPSNGYSREQNLARRSEITEVSAESLDTEMNRMEEMKRLDEVNRMEEMKRLDEVNRMAEEEVCISDGRMILVDNLLKVDTKTNTNEESKNQKEILEAFDDISKFETKTPEEQGEAINRIFEKFNKKIFEYLSRLEDFFENFKKKNNSFFEKVTNGGGGGNDMSSKIDMILTLLSLLISFLEGEEKKEEKEKNKLLAKKKDAERRKNEFEKRLDDVEAKLKKIGSELGELRKIKNKSEDKSKKDILSKIELLENEEETLTIEKEDIGKSIEMVKDEILKLEKDIKICDGNLDDLKEKIKLLKSVRLITIPIVSLNNFIFSKNVNKFLSKLSGSLSTLFLWGSDLAHLCENEVLSSGLGHLSTGTSIIANIGGKSIEGLAVDSVGVILENRDLESVEEVKDRVSQSVEEVKDGVSRSVEEVKDRVSRYVDSKDEDD